MEGTLTPIPQGRAMTMSFFDALKKIQVGKMVTRISWGNKDYCYMKDGWLSIFRNGKTFQWVINDGDMEAQDFIVITEPN